MQAGATWSRVSYLYNDTDPASLHDGLNLGSTVYDADTGVVTVFFTHCANYFGQAPCGPTATLLAMSSTDLGLNWGPVRNLTTTIVAGGFAMITPGPSTGIQLRRGPHAGRVLLASWGTRLGHRETEDKNAVSLWSDDHGASWQFGAIAPNTIAAVPNELQAAELADGTVLLNARDGAGPLRLLSRSSNGGATWSALERSPYLNGAICQGSMIEVDGTLFFSHPFASAVQAGALERMNGWIKFSIDGGRSWWLWRQVNPDEFAYSSLALLELNGTHVTLGLAYEDEAFGDHAKGSLKWAAIADFFPRAAAAIRFNRT